MPGKNIFEVKRQNLRGKVKVYVDNISSDGKTFINTEFDCEGGGHETEYDESQTQEFFKKFLKNRFSDAMLKKAANKIVLLFFYPPGKKFKIAHDRNVNEVYRLLKEFIREHELH